jgi:spore coat protein U-like protein
MTWTRALIIVAAIFFSGFLARQANAQACTVASTAAVFGSYNPGNTLPTDTTATVQVTCQLLAIGLLVPYTLTASAGAGGSFANRQLVNGSSAHTIVWGDGTGGSSAIQGSLTAVTGLIVIGSPIPIYGRVPAGQNPMPGSYSDTMMVTITY